MYISPPRSPSSREDSISRAETWMGRAPVTLAKWVLLSALERYSRKWAAISGSSLWAETAQPTYWSEMMEAPVAPCTGPMVPQLPSGREAASSSPTPDPAKRMAASPFRKASTAWSSVHSRDWGRV